MNPLPMPVESSPSEGWKEYREQVNQALSRYLDELGIDCPPRLRESIAYSLLAGGKRIRPVLVLTACEACGGSITSALPAACAIEMVHTYSLIHDDLPAMDDDDLRRGRPTNHVVFGEAMAILAGDALLTWSFELLAREIQPADVALACCVDLAAASGACGMVGGQVVDLEAETTPVREAEALVSIHRRKTGKLLSAGVTLGARIAGASLSQLLLLREYGDLIGLAFQIKDDLLDVQGNSEQLGKGTGKDAASGKATYPGFWGVAESERKAHALVDRACEIVSGLNTGADAFQRLARYIVERDR